MLIEFRFLHFNGPASIRHLTVVGNVAHHVPVDNSPGTESSLGFGVAKNCNAGSYCVVVTYVVILIHIFASGSAAHGAVWFTYPKLVGAILDLC
jgi:hypothetical protein